MSAMAPVVSKALTSAQLELNAGWQMKQDSMKEEMRAAQDKTLKRVAAMVTQKVDVMVDDVNQVMDVRSETESEDGEGEVTAGVKAKRQKLKPSRKGLEVSSQQVGEVPRKSNTARVGRSGSNIATEKEFLDFRLL